MARIETVKIKVDTRRFVAAMESSAAAVERLNLRITRAKEQLGFTVVPPRSTGPAPLCIDGHAYARKRRARRRR